MLWKGFQKPKRLEVDRDTLTDHYGRFFAQPFERGFATTVGNALRRVLLSSIEGAAITAVRVEGVLHEFSPIPGAMEDTTDLILNLKRIPLKMHVEHPKTLILKTSEPGEVQAKHITPDPDVEILDPEAYVATLGQGSTLSVEMRVKPGRGYVSADKNFDEDLSIGWIPLDSVHSPIKKVNYFVDAARVGQATDYEKLTLEVWANGAVTPRDAVGLAAKLMKDHLSIFINLEEEDEESGGAGRRDLGLRARSLDGQARTRAWTRWSSPSAPTTASRTPTSAPSASSCRRPRRTCSRPRTSAGSRLNEIKEILSGMGLSLGMKLDNWPASQPRD